MATIDTGITATKVFISYSWSSIDHEQWVLDLAIQLVESGVAVILDKWDLKEGYDAHVFMEQMVSDPTVAKVAIICDRSYVDRANGRTGGVGTETQIISPQVYNSQDQNKFVAIVKERDEDGKALVPVYYGARKYIDFSDQARGAASFDELIRWIYDQPLYKRPALGKKPGFLVDEERQVLLGTSSRQRRALDAIKNDRGNAIALTSEYLNTLADEMEKLRFVQIDGEFDDFVVASIESFLPYRNELIEVVHAVAVYGDSGEARHEVHRFLERALRYLERPNNASSWNETWPDNYRFIVHELFLYIVAIFLRHERFESAETLIGGEYYLPGRSDYGRDVMVSSEVFRSYMESFETRNRRLALRLLSMRATFLEQRSKSSGLEFRYVMQADFILYMRYAVLQNHQLNWWPETLLYAGRSSGPFEIFVRAKSTAYFNRIKGLIGVTSKEELLPLFESFRTDRSQLPRWDGNVVWPPAQMAFDAIATKP